MDIKLKEEQELQNVHDENYFNNYDDDITRIINDVEGNTDINDYVSKEY